MTNVPVKRGEAARQQPQVAVTDADREAADRLHIAQCPHGNRDACHCRQCVAQAIARARAEEREACALWHDDRAKHFARFNDEDAVRRHGIYATAIRARGNATLPAADAASEV